MADTSPQKAPETAPAKPSAASEVKITLDTTKGKLVDLRQRLGVEGVADPKKEKEIKEIEKRFEADKDKILTISQKSLDALKSDVHDANETIDGKFDVKPDGELVFEGKAESIPATPETPKALEVSLTAITGIKIPENVQEEMAKFSPKSGNFMQMILDKILDFFAGFAPDWVAKMRGFGNSALEKKADISYNTLIGDEGRAILDKSPLSNILILDHINKNEFKKILVQYPTLDFSNKKNLEAAFQGKYADDAGFNKYHRIHEGMREMCWELSSTESLSYNPTERLKRLLSYSRKEEMDAKVEENTPGVILTAAPVPGAAPAEIGPVTPEVQASKLNEAQKADKELGEAKKIAPETEESRKKVVEAQNKVDEIKNRERDMILGTLSETEKTLNDLINQSDVLKARNDTIPPELLTKIAAYTTAVKNIKENIIGNDKVVPPILAIGELAPDAKSYKILPDIGAERLLKASIAIQSIKDKINPKISTEFNKEDEKKVKEEMSQISNSLSPIFIVPPITIKNAQKLLDTHKEKPAFKEEVTNLNKNLEIAKAKIDLVITAIEKKKEMAVANRYIKWDNDDDDIHDGWVEIDGKEDADGSYLEFDVDGYFKVDWQLIRGDSPLVKKLGGLKNCRDILIANKNTIMNTVNTDSLKY